MVTSLYLIFKFNAERPKHLSSDTHAAHARKKKKKHKYTMAKEKLFSGANINDQLLIHFIKRRDSKLSSLRHDKSLHSKIWIINNFTSINYYPKHSFVHILKQLSGKFFMHF